jgi:hypothetical protein
MQIKRRREHVNRESVFSAERLNAGTAEQVFVVPSEFAASEFLEHSRFFLPRAVRPHSDHCRVSPETLFPYPYVCMICIAKGRAKPF